MTFERQFSFDDSLVSNAVVYPSPLVTIDQKEKKQGLFTMETASFLHVVNDSLHE